MEQRNEDPCEGEGKRKWGTRLRFELGIGRRENEKYMRKGWKMYTRNSIYIGMTISIFCFFLLAKKYVKTRQRVFQYSVSICS